MRLGRLDAHVVDLDHHVALHQPLDRVLTEAGQTALVALRVAVVRGHLGACGEQLGHLCRGGRIAGGVVVLRTAALLRAPEGAGGEELADVHGRSDGAGVHPHPAQGVVELVAQEHAAHTQLVQLVQTAVDVGLAALGDVEDLLAAEGLRGLDAEHHGELALRDDLAGLGRVGDDTEEALALSAVDLVDVVLHLVGLAGLETDGVHLVAAAVPDIDRAQQAVGDQVVDQHLLAAAPGALQPRVVILLVAEGVVGRPVLERRPAHRVVVTVRTAGDVLEEGERAVGIVLGTVLECVGDTRFGERLATDDATAEALVGHQMIVRVDEAADPALAVRAVEGFTGDVDLRVGGGPRRGLPPGGVGADGRRGAHAEGQQEGDDDGKQAASAEEGHPGYLRCPERARANLLARRSRRGWRGPDNESRVRDG